MALLPQVEGRSNISLVIIDNASEPESMSCIVEWLEQIEPSNIRYERNECNVGMSGNFLKCFEANHSPWLWILSDDDFISPNAVQLIEDHIEKYPEATYINFSCDSLAKENNRPCRTMEWTATGAYELFEKLDTFAMMTFISCGIFNARKINQLHVGYHYSRTYLNFLALVISAIGDDGISVFSPERLIARHEPAVGWSRLDYALACGVLLDLPFDESTRKLVRLHLCSTTLRFKTIATILIDQIRDRKVTKKFAAYMIAEIRHRLYPLHWDKYLATAIYIVCFHYKSVGSILRRTPIVKQWLFNEKK